MTANASDIAFAPAKINLTLHVTGQRSDGYHLLDSLVVFGDVGDILTFTPGPKMHLDVIGPFADGVPNDARNLVWKAAGMAGWTGHITLDKHLPHGAGLGGGSADAAAMLNYLKAPQLAPALGADVAVCLAQQAQRMQGIGEHLTPLKRLPSVGILLVNPNIAVPTPAVFKALKNKENPAMPVGIPAFKSARDLVQWLGEQRNDLEEAAIQVAPVIDQVLREISRQPGAHLSRMSGSGATCFGIFLTQGEMDQAQNIIERAHPDWWVFGSALI